MCFSYDGHYIIFFIRLKSRPLICLIKQGLKYLYYLLVNYSDIKKSKTTSQIVSKNLLCVSIIHSFKKKIKTILNSFCFIYFFQITFFFQVLSSKYILIPNFQCSLSFAAHCIHISHLSWWSNLLLWRSTNEQGWERKCVADGFLAVVFIWALWVW